MRPKGFSPLLIILIVAAVLAAGGGIYIIQKTSKSPAPAPTKEPLKEPIQSAEEPPPVPTPAPELPKPPPPVPPPTAPSQPPAPAPPPAGGPPPIFIPPPPEPPPPAPIPAPPPAPPPSPPEESYSTEADDNGFYPSNLITVSQNAKVTLTFNVRSSGVYFGGLDFRSSKFNTSTVLPGGSTSVEFIADKSFNITSYWPVSNAAKASLHIEAQ